jgi:hypothetical protein
MENYKTIQISALKQNKDARQRSSEAQISPEPVFDVIGFIKESRKDSTFLLALIR